MAPTKMAATQAAAAIRNRKARFFRISSRIDRKVWKQGEQ
jgi:hypothetical protein